ncbi:hypothetical protein KUTeg_021778 [Tegillarca granosa]|uniref:DUF985 domain-containing protein n=1 Tax=Tegillarca granosa TaxID=220873 RepID=A0ABQ9E4B6_TEGGR|nr:hypothetical protein KUTeg_021778 [Tegillarca granosa]
MAAEEIERLKKQFDLIDHPEGGFFAEKWRGDRKCTLTQPNQYDGPRDVASSIYYLLTSPNYISWHKHLSEEIFYWHAGGPLKVLISKIGHQESNQNF